MAAKKLAYIEGTSYVDNEEYLRAQLLKTKRQMPVLESERVFHFGKGVSAAGIVAHIKQCKTHFVTPDHPDLAPSIPEELDIAAFLPKEETTAARERYYIEDCNGSLTDMGCEVRIEALSDRTFKQTTKTARRGHKGDPTLNRMEQSRRMRSFGLNIFALNTRLTRKLSDRLEGMGKPVIRMVSQRIRIPYHPDGNQKILIEAAIEPIHFGETISGFCWSAPKIDLEIKVGPKDEEQRRAVLVREENYLTQQFDLVRELRSSPSPGFDALFDAGLDRYLEIFEGVPERKPWRNAQELTLHG